jgi:hypothetical protein
LIVTLTYGVVACAIATAGTLDDAGPNHGVEYQVASFCDIVALSAASGGFAGIDTLNALLVAYQRPSMVGPAPLDGCGAGAGAVVVVAGEGVPAAVVVGVAVVGGGLGAGVGAGAGTGPTMADAGETAATEPFLFEAATATRMVEPTSGDPSP